MESTIWKKYKFDKKDKIPNEIKKIIVEVCKDLDKIEFDKNYCKFYFIGENDENYVIGENGQILNAPKDLKRSRRWVENLIYDVWNRNDLTANEILRILAWKTGKINHNKCGETKTEIKPSIMYDVNWVEGDEKDSIVSLQLPYQETVKGEFFQPIAKRISEIRKRYCNDKDAEAVWEELLNLVNEEYKAILKGLGTVYLITLLHFITGEEPDGAKYPIYDRFAMASLLAWKMEQMEDKDGRFVTITKDTVVRGCALPSKNTNSAKNILKKGLYADYITLLKDFCKIEYENENEWRNNRDVDRALWVYGHFFDVKD